MLSHLRGELLIIWIPAYAGMTRQWIIEVDLAANQPSSARTFTVFPFTLPADNLRTASRAMLRTTAT